MKQFAWLICSISFLLIIGCEEEEKLTFKNYVIEKDSCNECAKVEITIPQATGNSKLAQSINRALEEEIMALLSFDEATDVANLEEAIISFKKVYKEFLSENDAVGAEWEATFDAAISFENEHLISINLESFLNTGGAHGSANTTLLNFDVYKEVLVENWELFDDLDRFIVFAETKFKLQEKIEDDNINATGFMFEKDQFYLPENICFTKNGLLLLYNPYEIGSYADGAIVLYISHAEVSPFLMRQYKLATN